MSRSKIPEIIAAVDLGSNSFHMVVARHLHGQLTIIDRLREPVRLAFGLDEQGRLSREVMDKALACYKEIYEVDYGYEDVAQRVESSYTAG